MKHTSGPWQIDVGNYHAGHIASVDHNGHVMEIWSETWPLPEDGPANAKLIAAAPELLDVVRDYLESGFDVADTPLRQRARAVFAKATES